MKNKVLLSSYGGGHINMLIPVYRELVKDPDIETQFFALTTAGNTLSQMDIPFHSYKDLITSEDQDALAWGEKLLAEMGDSKVIPTEESIAYLGLSFKDLVLRQGESQAAETYNKLGRHAFLQLSIAERIINRYSPNLVITTNAPKTEEALVLKSTEMGVASLVIWDLFQEKDFQRLSRKNYGSKLCVLSQKVKDGLIEAGRKSEEIAVTGNPALDPLLLKLPDAQQEADQFLEKIGAQGKRVVLWAQQSWPDMADFNNKVVQTLLNHCENTADTFVIVRPHPNDNLFKDFAHPSLYISREPSSFIPTLLKASSAAISINSTLILECQLAGLESYTLEWTSKSQNMSFAAMGVTEGLQSLEELGRAFTPSENLRTSSGDIELALASTKVMEACLSLLEN